MASASLYQNPISAATLLASLTRKALRRSWVPCELAEETFDHEVKLDQTLINMGLDQVVIDELHLILLRRHGNLQQFLQQFSGQGVEKTE